MSLSQQMIDAVQAGDAATVTALLGTDPGLAAHQDSGSPVLTALYNGHADVRETLLSAHPTLDIFEAAAVGDGDRIRTLIHGEPALASAFSDDGWTPIHLAAFFHQPEAVRLLAESGASLETVSRNGLQVTPLQSALASGSVPAARALISHGADVRSGGATGWTPLHYAAANSLPDLAKELIDRGTAVNAMNGDGKTPLALALEAGREEMVALLRRHGAEQ